jgi:P-type Cu2+ transporter
MDHPDHNMHEGENHPAGHNHHAEENTHDVVHPSHTTTDHETPHVHDKHAGHHTTDFLKRFWICLLLTLPVLLLSHMIQEWFGFRFVFAGDKYVLLIFGTLIYLYGGMPFIKGMISEVRDKAPGMMTLVALAITVAYLYSGAVIFGLRGMDFFWELATLIDIMLIGHWLEMRSAMAAGKALESLVALLPDTVHVENNATISDVPIKEIHENDIVVVRPGERVPADGFVTEGNSFINESMLTGESVPVKKAINDKLIAGSINGDGYLKLKVKGSGEKTYLNKVIGMVKTAQAAKSKTQNLADKVAKWLTIISIIAGVTTFIGWYSNHELAFALERMVTVMVTACPHALGVAIPLVVALSTATAASNGLLIRNRTAFENSRKLTTIVFDKTGTLTKGAHEVQKIISLDEGYSAGDILLLAGSAEQHSEHYIGKGIINKLHAGNLQPLPLQEFHYDQGVGVSGIINGKKIIVAGPNYFSNTNKPLPAIPGEIDQEIESYVFVITEDRIIGIISFADQLRDTSAEAIRRLKEMNIKSWLITGDNEKLASAVAKKLGMDGFMANVLPHQKQEKVKELQDGGEVVAMTGDGVNDAPALAQADVGIAIGSGTEVAAETADIILVNSDPLDVVNMIGFGRATYRKMIENLVWAAGYNIIAIPLAAGILYPRFVLSPAMDAILMSVSTIVVAINAKSLQMKKV